MCETVTTCSQPNRYWVQITDGLSNIQACGVHLTMAVRTIDATRKTGRGLVTVKTNPRPSRGTAEGLPRNRP